MKDEKRFEDMNDHQFAFAIKQALNEVQDVEHGEPKHVPQEKLDQMSELTERTVGAVRVQMYKLHKERKQ